MSKVSGRIWSLLRKCVGILREAAAGFQLL